jgi:class 3 adenylate cyclase
MRELDPEEARAVVDPVLHLMMDAVHRYDGYVAQSTGDGIFAMFVRRRRTRTIRNVRCALRSLFKRNCSATPRDLKGGFGLRSRFPLGSTPAKSCCAW